MPNNYYYNYNIYKKLDQELLIELFLDDPVFHKTVDVFYQDKLKESDLSPSKLKLRSFIYSNTEFLLYKAYKTQLEIANSRQEQFKLAKRNFIINEEK
jgi:hypothetical protein